MTALVGVSAVVFDAYGTLLDLQGSLQPHVDPLGEEGRRLLATWRQKQLEYSWLRSLMGRYADFERVTADALDYALEVGGLDDAALRARLLSAYRQLAGYPEAADVLRRIRDGGLRTAVLSNGSPDMLRVALTAAGLLPLLDEVLSVESVQVYKPARAVYALACDRLRLTSERIAFVSGNGWDQAGAAVFGVNVVAIVRGPAVPDRLPGEPLARISDLGGLLPLLGLPARCAAT